MENFKIAALALGLLILSGCATYDRVAVRDYSGSARVAAVSPADATPGAGGPGGAGAGVAR